MAVSAHWVAGEGLVFDCLFILFLTSSSGRSCAQELVGKVHELEAVVSELDHDQTAQQQQ